MTFWETVQKCLVVFHEYTDGKAAKTITRCRKGFADTMSDEEIEKELKQSPFDFACELTRNHLDQADHQEEYQEILNGDYLETAAKQARVTSQVAEFYEEPEEEHKPGKRREIWICTLGDGQKVRKSLKKLDAKVTFPYDHRPDGTGSFWCKTDLAPTRIACISGVREC